MLNSRSAVTARPRGARPPAKPKLKLNIEEDTLTDLAEVFGLLADESRLKILLSLAQAGEMHVSALCELLDQSQPAVSHHLTLLRAQHMVRYRRDGKHNFYRVDTERACRLFDEFFAAAGNGQKQLSFPGFSLAYRATNGAHAKKR